MRIAIVPTGVMEHIALPRALQSIFTEHEFYSVVTPEEFETGFPINGFTTGDVTRLGDEPNNADDLISRAVAATLRTRTQTPADLAIILDDVELCNIHQPDAVARAMRNAAVRHLDKVRELGNLKTVDNTTEALRERVSFHLSCPMIEAWIFAYANGPRNAGVSGERGVQLLSADPEEFETNDPDYLHDDANPCVRWHSLPRTKQRKHRPLWLRPPEIRRRHPKAYLAWLCIDPTASNCTRYTETESGASALANVDWGALLGAPGQARFARALMDDIADRLGLDSPFPGELAPSTALSRRPRDHVLRNL